MPLVKYLEEIVAPHAEFQRFSIFLKITSEEIKHLFSLPGNHLLRFFNLFAYEENDDFQQKVGSLQKFPYYLIDEWDSFKFSEEEKKKAEKLFFNDDDYRKTCMAKLKGVREPDNI